MADEQATPYTEEEQARIDAVYNDTTDEFERSVRGTCLGCRRTVLERDDYDECMGAPICTSCTTAEVRRLRRDKEQLTKELAEARAQIAQLIVQLKDNKPDFICYHCNEPCFGEPRYLPMRPADEYRAFCCHCATVCEWCDHYRCPEADWFHSESGCGN